MIDEWSTIQSSIPTIPLYIPEANLGMEPTAVAQISPRPYLGFQQSTTFSMQTSTSMALSLTVTMIGSMSTPTAAAVVAITPVATKPRLVEAMSIIPQCMHTVLTQ